jgi:hypothetical protein
MLRIRVRSRFGNVALALLGAVYALSAAGVLIWFLVDVKSAAATLDRLMQFGLLVAALCGVWFILNSLDNLGMRRHGRSFTAH